eukprot:scaffold97916_cov27-Prasinocladus_malaysianus.AAC.1
MELLKKRSAPTIYDLAFKPSYEYQMLRSTYSYNNAAAPAPNSAIERRTAPRRGDRLRFDWNRQAQARYSGNPSRLFASLRRRPLLARRSVAVSGNQPII